MFDFGFNAQEYINNLDSTIKNLEKAYIRQRWSSPSSHTFYKCNMGGVKEVTLSSKNSLYSDITPDSCVIEVSEIRTVVYFVKSNGYNYVELRHNIDLDEYVINDVSVFQMQMEKRGYNITYVQPPITKDVLFNLNLKYNMVDELFAVMKIVQDNIDIFYREFEEDF